MDCQHAVSATGPNWYENIKTSLIKAYGKTEATKNAELLEMASRPGSLGDRRPSNILMKIQTLSGASYDALERAMFLNHMPLSVRTALASSEARTNDELATEVDAIMEEYKNASKFSATPHAVTAVEVDAAFHQRSFKRPQDALCY